MNFFSVTNDHVYVFHPAHLKLRVRKTYIYVVSRTMFREKHLLQRDLMLGKTFYSPNLTNLFYFSAPKI